MCDEERWCVFDMREECRLDIFAVKNYEKSLGRDVCNSTDGITVEDFLCKRLLNGLPE